jgi:hypothetical protein
VASEYDVFERSLSSKDRPGIAQEIASRGEAALPLLQALFDGTATNRYGIAYRLLGPPLDCAIHAAGELGPLSRPLEPFLRDAVRNGNAYAPAALGALGALESETVGVLARALASNDANLGCEAAAALIRCGFGEHPEVQRAADASPMSRRVFDVAASANRRSNAGRRGAT